MSPRALSAVSTAAAPADPPHGLPPANWSMIAVIIGLLLQAATALWWAAAMDRRVAAIEEASAPLRSGVLARLDERTAAFPAQLDRIERRLDKIEDRR